MHLYPSDGEPETGRPQRLAGEQTLHQMAKFFTKFIIKEGRKRGESEKGRFERGREGESWLFQD